MNRARRSVIMFGLLCAVLVGVPAWGQGAARGQGTLSASSDAGHLWFAMQGAGGDSDSDPGDAVGVWHVAARAQGGAASGTVRFAYALETMAVGLAADGDRVALFFARGSGFMVRGLGVVRAGDGWQNASVGRLEAMASLDVGGELIGAAWNELGLLALVRTEGGAVSLYRLADGAWGEVALVGVDSASVVGMVELGGEAVGLIGAEGGSLWRGGRDADGAWQWTQSAIPDGLGDQLLSGRDGELIGVAWNEGGGGTVWRARCDGLRLRVGTLAGWCRGSAGVLRADDRIVVLGVEGERTLESSAGGGKPRIFEMSLLSGRVFADGEAEVRAPVLERDLRLLVASMLLVVFMVIAMVGVRMPEPPTVPAGWVLAPGFARVLAAAGDVMVSALVVSALTGESLTRTLWLESGMGFAGAANLGMVLVVAFCQATVLEWLFGASVGKLVVGCRVIGAQGEEGRIGLGRIAARNAVKWLLPVSVLMAWVDPYGRHTGDAVARTVVVMGVVEES